MCVFDPSYSKNLLNLWVRLWEIVDRCFVIKARTPELRKNTLSTDPYPLTPSTLTSDLLFTDS